MESLMENSQTGGDLRLIHMCSQSDGACALILAERKGPRKFLESRSGSTTSPFTGKSLSISSGWNRWK
jgi:hypothetical protein